MLIRGSAKRMVRSLPKTSLAIAAFILIGCAISGTPQQASQESISATIEAVKVSSSGDKITIVEIVNSESVPYTSFQLIDPPRVVLDIGGLPANELPPVTQVNDANVTDIRLEQRKAKAMTTRVVVGLAR